MNGLGPIAFALALSSIGLSASAKPNSGKDDVLSFGASKRDIEVQTLKNFESLQSMSVPQLRKLFEKITSTYRRKGYGKIAGALRGSQPALRDLLTADSPAPVGDGILQIAPSAITGTSISLGFYRDDLTNVPTDPSTGSTACRPVSSFAKAPSSYPGHRGRSQS